MATYYVDGVSGSDGAAGSSGSPWKTLAKANNSTAAGDTVKVRTATYYESLVISKSNLTFEADTGHTPTIDGRYTPALFGAAGFKTKAGRQVTANELPYPSAANATTGNWVFPGANIDTKGFAFLVQVKGTGAKLKGFVIRNSCCRGVGMTGDNTVLENCRIDFTYGGSMSVEDFANIKVLDCTLTRGSVKVYDPTRENYPRVQTSLIIKGRDTLVEGTIVAYCFGEGISCDKGSVRPIIRFNTCHTSAHWGLGINETNAARIYGNLVYWCDNLVSAMGKSTPADLFTVGNEQVIHQGVETPSKATLPDTFIYNNLFIGGKRAFVGSSGSSERPVAFYRGYIGYNTIVGRANSESLFTWGTYSKNTHQNTVVENNILIRHANGGNLAKFEAGGTVTWRNNLFNASVASGMNGAGSITTAQAAATLVNAFPAAINGTFNVKSTDLPDVTTTLNEAHFNLGATSQAIGRGSNRSSPYSWTIPNINVDRAGAGRTDFNAGQGRYYDLGQMEYDGTAPPEEDDSVTASFNRTPGSGNAPLSVSFTDTSQVTGDAVINSWLWNFGDGDTSTSQNPTHVYSAAGTYTVTLTVQDTVLALSSSVSGGSVTVTAAETGSVRARFTRSPAAAEVGDTITFADTSTAEGDGVINSWAWDFRDETSSTLQNPTKVYAAAGTYRPRLTVRDTVRGYVDIWTGPETVITDAPPADGIEAGFSQSATGGQAPLTVNFTDESQEAGSASIDEWEWDFGDGSGATTASPSHVYAAAGSYVPRLTVRDTVRGLVDTFTGETVVVTTPPPPDAGGDVRLRQARTALNTSSGNQTFSQSGLGGITPKSARFIITGATADGTAADGELFCYGATAGGSQWAGCIAAQHGVADTNAARMWTDAACLLLIDGSGNEVARATFVGWTTNGVTIDLQWTGTPAAYLMTVVFGAGTEYEAWVGTAALGAVGSSVSPVCGFAADVVRGVATWGSRETAEADATLSMGLAHREGGQYALDRRYHDGQSDGLNRLRLFENDVLHCRYNTSARGEASVSAWSSTGFTVAVSSDGINSTGLFMAERFGEVGSRVALVDSATATGNTDYALEWDPQYVEHLLSPATAVGSYNDAQKAGTIGIHTVTDDGEFSNEVSGENGSATTNEQSLSDNQLIVVGHTGTTLAAGATTLGTEKYTINYTTAPGTAMKWPSLAVEEGAATGGGGDYLTAEFQADVQAGNTPLRVRFTDLSSGTNTITSWAWDFGDGATSTERNPVHVYREEGSFTVSLTVGDGTLTDVEEKGGLIQSATVRLEEFLVGPFLMRSITENSSPVTHKDPEDEENAGYMEGGLLLGAIRIGADPEEPAAGSGDVPVWYDPDTDLVYLKRPDGTIKTIG